MISTQLNPYQKNYSQAPNFKGARLPHQTFEEFERFSKKTNFLQHISEFMTPENFIGEGAKHKVYSIPNNDTFLIRIKKAHLDDIYKNYPLTKAQNPFPNHNLGQKVAQIGKNIEIIIKQEGIVNGLTDRDNFKAPWHTFPKSKVPEVINNLELLSQMPQSAYNTLAKEVKLIHRQDHLFDSYNPNNILIDQKNKSLNIVDVDPHLNAKPYKKFLRFTSSNQLLASLLDTPVFVKAYKTASIEQKKQISEFSNIIKIKAENTCLKKRDFWYNLRQRVSDIKHHLNSLSEYKEMKRIVSRQEP